MALIVCPECNKEISDKIKNCIYCGYPVSRYKIQNYPIGQKTYDLSFILDNTVKKRDKIKKFQELSGFGLKESMNIVQNIYKEYDVLDDNAYTQTSKEEQRNAYKVHCPYCNSTDISKITATERAISVVGLGILSKKINKSFKCKECGGTF